MTSEILKKKIEIDTRFFDQQSKQAIRQDIVRALIELITNSDDSYLSLESKGIKTTGDIILSFCRQRNNLKLYVRDNAEGMSLKKLVEVTGKYSGATSSLYESGGAITRGMFGRGLKDTIMALGSGKILSFNGGYINEVKLSKVDKEWTIFYPNENTNVKKQHLDKYNVKPKSKNDIDPHATIVEIDISKNFKIPLFKTIYSQLCQHFALRRIVNNPSRNVILRQIDNNNKIINEEKVQYKLPEGKIVVDKNLKPENLSFNIELEIYRCNVKLDTPSESGPLASGGIIIESNNIPLDLTMCGEGGNPNACWFWGTAKCDKLIKRALKDDSIISATRDGLNWDHKVNTFIKTAIQKELKVLIKIEDEISKKLQRKKISKDLQIRNTNVLDEINKIAKKELEDLLEGPLKTKYDVQDLQIPFVPDMGFGFVPEFSQIKYGKESYLLLRGKTPHIIKATDLITIKSENEHIEIKDRKVRLEPRKDFPHIGECKIYLKGTKIGVQGVISAEINDLKSEALVEIVIKKSSSHTSPKNKKGGFIQRYSF